jgi:hypothetical protein
MSVAYGATQVAGAPAVFIVQEVKWTKKPQVVQCAKCNNTGECKQA